MRILYILCLGSLILGSCTKEVEPIIPKDWVRIEVLDKDEGIVDIEFADEKTGYLIGSKLMKTTDGGYNWNEVPGIEFRGYQIYAQQGDLYIIDGKMLALIRNDKFFDTLRFKERLSDIQMINQNTGYLVSCRGVYRTSDRGVSWSRQFQVGDSSCRSFSALFFRNTNLGWVGIGDTLYRTVNGGATYTKIKVAENIRTWYNISAPSDNNVFMVTDKGVYKSNDGGRTVSRFKTAPGWSFFTEVYFEDDRTGYMIGGNSLSKTVNGGDSWEKIVKLSMWVNIEEIDFLDKNNGWACLTDGSILKFKR